MCVEIDAKRLRALDHILTTHSASKSLVFHLLLHGPSVDLHHTLGWPNERRGGDQASELVDGEQRLGHQRRPRHTAVPSVSHDRVEDVLRPAKAAEMPNSPGRMLLGWRVGGVRISLVIEVVNES